MAPLVACPHCNVHAKLTETVCPHCGNVLRRSDGTIPKTAAAVILGLTIAAGCGDDEGGSGGAGGSDPVAEYGVAAVGGMGGTTDGGMGGTGGAGGNEPTPDYGVAGAGG